MDRLMIAVLETYFGHGITPGEAIVIALTTIPLLIGLVLWVRKVRFLLSLEFYVPESSEKYRRFQQVAEGEWPIKIRLKARVPEKHPGNRYQICRETIVSKVVERVPRDNQNKGNHQDGVGGPFKSRGMPCFAEWCWRFFSFILRHLKQGQRATISTFILPS